MKRLDIIRRAGRNLKQAKVRTLLTALAISVGAFTLTLSLAIGAGTREYFAKFLETNVNPQSLFVVADKKLVGFEGGNTGPKEYDPGAANISGSSYKTLGQSDLDKIAANKNISSVQPNYNLEATYFTYQGNSKKFTGQVGMYDKTIRGEAAAGSLPKLGTMIGADDIVVPESYLKALGIKNAKDAIGKTITVHVAQQAQTKTTEELQALYAQGGLDALTAATQGKSQDVSFKISAVAAKPATALSDNVQLNISDTRAQELADFTTQGTSQHKRYIAAIAMVKDGVKPETAKAELEKTGLTVKTARDLQGILFTVVNVVQGIVAGFGVLALLASIFGIINTQYISVLERTGQIGLMKALGMSNRAIGRLFRYEAAWIGFLGAILGALGGIGLGTLLNPWISRKMSLGAGSHLLIFQPLPICLLILALVLVAIVAGWFPSRKAARLDPIEALRTE